MTSCRRPSDARLSGILDDQAGDYRSPYGILQTMNRPLATGQTAPESSREPKLETRENLALGESRHRTIGVSVAPRRVAHIVW